MKKKKIEINPKLKLLGNILYWILVVIVLIILFLVVLQRVSNNNMTIGGIRIFNIVTESMVPEYVVGDVLISKEVDGEIHFITQGVANPDPDPQIRGDQVLGKITYKTIILSALSKLMNNLYGFYFVVFVPLTTLIIFEIRKFIKSFRHDDEEDEKEEETDKKEEDDKNS